MPLRKSITVIYINFYIVHVSFDKIEHDLISLYRYIYNLANLMYCTCIILSFRVILSVITNTSDRVGTKISRLILNHEISGELF